MRPFVGKCAGRNAPAELGVLPHRGRDDVPHPGQHTLDGSVIPGGDHDVADISPGQFDGGGEVGGINGIRRILVCLLYTSPSPRD